MPHTLAIYFTSAVTDDNLSKEGSKEGSKVTSKVSHDGAIGWKVRESSKELAGSAVALSENVIV